MSEIQTTITEKTNDLATGADRLLRALEEKLCQDAGDWAKRLMESSLDIPDGHLPPDKGSSSEQQISVECIVVQLQSLHACFDALDKKGQLDGATAMMEIGAADYCLSDISEDHFSGARPAIRTSVEAA